MLSLIVTLSGRRSFGSRANVEAAASLLGKTIVLNQLIGSASGWHVIVTKMVANSRFR